jgi:hypothetical protein
MDLSALESISKALEKSLDFWGLMLLLATALVVTGLVIEYWHDVQEFWMRLTWPMASFPWDKFTALAGGILVTIGVALELLFTFEASRVETQLRENIHKIEALLTQEAGDAADSAKTAHAELNAIRQEAVALQTRLKAASAQLGKIEEQVRTLEPRWKILADNKNVFIHDLKPFSGTRLTVLICGGLVSPIEQLGTEQRLLDLLGKSGANWETGYQPWSTCAGTSSNGLEMVVSKNAGEATKRAGDALRDELLGFGIATSLDVVPPERAKFMASGLGSDSPWAKTIQEPNTIFLLVAPNAMVESAKPTKKAAKTPR